MYYNLDSKHSSKNFSFELANLILESGKSPVFVCIGSNKIVDDSLGAITGELLKKYYKINASVFGMIDSPLVGNNLKQKLQKIKSENMDKLVVVIDACVGRLEHLYDITLNKCSINIDYQNLNLKIGDVSISAITYVKGINSLLLLPIEKKRSVFKCALFIATSIFNALNMVDNLNERESRYNCWYQNAKILIKIKIRVKSSFTLFFTIFAQFC